MTDSPLFREAVEAMRDVRNRRPVNSTMNCEAQLTAAFPHLDRLFREKHAQELGERGIALSRAALDPTESARALGWCDAAAHLRGNG